MPTNQPPATPASDAMTPEEIAAIRERAEKATAPPWFVNSIYGMHSDTGIAARYVESESRTICQTGKTLDPEFIAHARQDIPRLLAEVARLQAALTGAESQTQHFRESFAEQAQEVDRLEQELAESKLALIDCRDYMDGKTTDPVQAIISVKRVLKMLAANEQERDDMTENELLRLACVYAERDQLALMDAYSHMPTDPAAKQAAAFVKRSTP